MHQEDKMANDKGRELKVLCRRAATRAEGEIRERNYEGKAERVVKKREEQVMTHDPKRRLMKGEGKQNGAAETRYE